MKRTTWYAIIPMLLLVGCNGKQEAAKADQEAAISAKRDLAKAIQSQKKPERISSSAVSAKKEMSSSYAGKPNVVLVLLDTVRPDYLGFMGFERDTAPFLTELAKDSAVFENALSASSWTAPSVASMFTSLYPPQHGVVQGFRLHLENMEKLKEQGKATVPLNSLPEGRDTLPQRFKKLGYGTYGLAANINIGEEIGFDRGFKRFEKHVKAPAESIYQKAMEWKDDILKEERFFLYLHFNDAHFPYNKREEYFKPAKDKKGDAAARYLSEIGYLDSYLRKVVDAFKGDNTLFVFVSDHGEEFWDHGGTHHGPTLYWELNHVLLMVHGPGSGVKPARFAQNVSLVDVLPTLMDFVEGPKVEDAEGLSLKPILVNGDGANSLKGRLGARTLFGHRMYSSRRNLALWSVTSGKWKLIDWFGDRRKLFDHKSDPGEFHDIKSQRMKMTEQLTERVGVFKERMKKAQTVSEKTEVSLDQGLVERLKTLGYVE